MAGNGPGVKLALVLDGFNMTDQQKAGIYPSLSQLLSDRRSLRGLQGVTPAKAGCRGAGAAVASANGEEKPVTLEEMEASVMKMREDVQAFKAACEANLSASQAQQVMDALDQGAARRLSGN